MVSTVHFHVTSSNTTYSFIGNNEEYIDLKYYVAVLCQLTVNHAIIQSPQFGFAVGRQETYPVNCELCVRKKFNNKKKQFESLNLSNSNQQ